MNLSAWCSRIIRWSYYLLFALVPLLLTPWNYELFEYNKMMAVYGLTAVITTAWLVKMAHEKEIRVTRTPLDIPIALFFISQMVSSVFSTDPHVSWLGYYSRFNGGMWSIISYILLYYAFVSNLTSWSNWKNLIKVALASASVVALYGVAERLGVDKHLWVQDVQNRVFSTLGQPNWLAAYLVALLPISLAFGLQSQISKIKTQNNSKIQNSKFEFILDFGFWIWSFIAILFFVVLLFTRSRSGLVGFAVADITFWAFSFARGRLAKLRAPFFLLHAAFALIIFFNGSNIAQIDKYFSLPGLLASKDEVLQGEASQASPGPALESGGTESGEIRKYVWQGAVSAWKSSTKTLLIGTGTETFAFAFYQHRPIGHNLTSEWDFLYNKAHNEYLNYLATTGLFGLGSYLLFIGTFVFWFIKKVHGSWFMVHRKEKNVSATNDERITINSALFAGWLSILVTNFFGFSVVIVQVFLFLFPAMIIITTQQIDKLTIQQFTRKLTLPSWSIWVLAAGGLMILVRIGSLWYADTVYAAGYRLARSGQYDNAKASVERAIALNPGEPVYRDEVANTLTALSVAAFEGNNATLSAQLARDALAQNDQAIRISPDNVNFWKTRTKIYYSLSGFDELLNDAAIAALEKAAALSPNDPKIYYNLAILYGRAGNNEQAVDTLTRAIALKPNYRDAYYALYVFYMEMKKPIEARAVLEEYLRSVDPADSNFREILDKSTP